MFLYFIYILVSYVSPPCDDVICWHFLARFILSDFLVFFTERVPGLIWFGSAYGLTTAGGPAMDELSI